MGGCEFAEKSSLFHSPSAAAGLWVLLCSVVDSEVLRMLYCKDPVMSGFV